MRKTRPTCREVILECECCKSTSRFFMTNEEIFNHIQIQQWCPTSRKITNWIPIHKDRYIECHRCGKRVPREDLMLLGCKQCGGIDGSKSYSLIEAKYGRTTKRHYGGFIY